MTKQARSLDKIWFLTEGSGQLMGLPVQEQQRTTADLAGVFADERALGAMAPKRLVYRVQLYRPVAEGTAGGLFFGNTRIEPGRVGDEYFMTKGHFHACRNRGEYYWCLSGEGALILMTEDRRCWVEWMRQGSLHYIPGYTAHRVANIGHEPLTFGACWPADAGHDYDTIASNGFSMRLRCVDGGSKLLPAEQS